MFQTVIEYLKEKKKQKKPSHELVIQHFISPISRQATEPDKPLFKETPCNIYSKMRKKVFSHYQLKLDFQWRILTD